VEDIKKKKKKGLASDVNIVLLELSLDFVGG
jgi:hypothetical protein